MLSSNLKHHVQPLIDLIESNTGIKLKFVPANVYRGRNFYLRSRTVSMYMRFNRDLKNSFVIAVIDVVKTRRRKGLGKTIVLACIEFAKEAGFDTVVAENVVSLEGKALAASCGFQPISDEEGCSWVFHLHHEGVLGNG